MKCVIILFLLIPLMSSAQTFYVEGKDDRSREHVEQKIRYEGYKVVDSTQAEYTVQMLTDGAYKVVSFKRPYNAYIRIVDNATGEEVARTEKQKGTPSVYNGYNASWMIYTKICKKYLPAALKKCKTKQ